MSYTAGDGFGLANSVSGDASLVRVHLDSVDLDSQQKVTFPSEGVTVIVGANNSGKSTLLRNIFEFLSSGSSAFSSSNGVMLGASMTRNIEAADLYAWLMENAIRTDAAQGAYFAVDNQIFSEKNVWDGSHSHPFDALQDCHGLFVHHADTRNRLNFAFHHPGRDSVDEPASSPFHRFQDERDVFEKLNDLCSRIFNRNLLLDDFPGATIRIRVGKTTTPLPARNEPLGEFGKEVSMMPLLDDQGDGMRSLLSLMIPIVAGKHQIVIVDEPEAFLHPPQARALGRELGTASKDTKKQIIVATHDRNFIAGLIESTAEITVIRLSRDARETKSAQLSSSQLRKVWDDRDLRYSNILDGLFSKLVVLCESDQDCRFYEAVLDQRLAETRSSNPPILLADEVLFVPVNGKARFEKLVPILQSLQVPVAVIADIDLLREPSSALRLFSLLGGEPESAKRDLTIAISQFANASRPRFISDVARQIQKTLESQVRENPEAQYDRQTKRLVDDALRPEVDRWSEPKRYGFKAFRGDASRSLLAVIEKFDGVGLAIVEVGELEGFAPSIDKGRHWLPAALDDGQHRAPAAFRQIDRILEFYRKTIFA